MKNILLTTKSAPVYSVLGLSEFLINPYREFVYFTVTSVFPELEHKSHMSMRQFYDMKDKNKQKGITDRSSDALGIATKGINGYNI